MFLLFLDESESDDELGVGHPHEKQHTIIESGGTDESDPEDN